MHERRRQCNRARGPSALRPWVDNLPHNECRTQIKTSRESNIHAPPVHTQQRFQIENERDRAKHSSRH